MKNITCASLSSSIDIPETVLELAGIPIPETMQGKSLGHLLKNPDTIINEDVLIEMDDEYINEKTRTLITEEGWRLTVFSNIDNEGQLFNLKDDPNEMDNLWNNKSYKDIKSDLVLRLLRKNLNNLESIVNRDSQY